MPRSKLMRSSEAIEDLTGGVTNELFTSDVLDPDRFWEEELVKVNKDFLFGCATGAFDDSFGNGEDTYRDNIISMHAYSIMEAREIKGQRLVKVRYRGPSPPNAVWMPAEESLTNSQKSVGEDRMAGSVERWLERMDSRMDGGAEP
jgi:hypothetical protein